MILLDTHVVVWLSTDKRQLSDVSAEAIRDASRENSGVAIASSTLWEIAMMSEKGRFRLPKALGTYLRYVESMFVVVPITAAITERAMLFADGYPRDPTDRLIGATAVVHGMKLVTKDGLIRASGEVPTVW